MLIFTVGTVGGYRFRSGQWPGLKAVQAAGATLTLKGSRAPNLPRENPQATADYLRSVVAITAKDQHGSGFVIDNKGHVVTANHVVNGASCVTVEDNNGRPYQASVLATDTLLDVALLHVAGLVNYGYHLDLATATSPAEIGQETYVVGYPRGTGSNMVTTATVTKLGVDQSAAGRYHKGLVEVSDGVVPKGHSGAPLVLKSTGKVIGMMLLSGDPHEIAWARPAADIEKLLAAWSSLRPTKTCQTAAPAKTVPLTLVSITPRTGTYGPEGEELADGADMAVKSMQERLRSVGYEVTLKREDDAGAPAKARERAELAALDPSVIGVVGSLESQTTRSIAEALATAALPVVAPTAAADELTAAGWPHFSRVVARNARQNPVLATFAKDILKVENVFVLEDGSADAASQLTAFKDAAAVIGLPISGTMKITQSTEPTQVKKHLAEARAEAIFFAGRSDLALRLVGTLRAQDVQLPFLGNQTAFAPAQFQTFKGPGAQGIYFTRLTAEPVEPFRRSYEESFGKPLRGYAAYGYDAAYVILDALRRYGESHQGQAPSRSELARLVRESTGTGWTAPIAFERNGDNQRAWVHVYEWNQGEPLRRVNL